MKRREGLCLQHELTYYINPTQWRILSSPFSDALLLELHTGLNCMVLFDRDIFIMGAIEEPSAIPEIKYDHFLSQTIRGLFSSKIRPRMSVRKFVICKKHYKYNNWEDN